MDRENVAGRGTQDDGRLVQKITALVRGNIDAALVVHIRAC
jgi:hypothetical protein